MTLVKREGESICPTVYLDSEFEKYEATNDIDEALDNVAHVVATNRGDAFAEIASNYTNYEFVKDKVIMALVNANKNKEFLLDTPHTMKEDLAVIYKVVVNSDNEGVASVTVKDSHLESWGVSKEELHELALENSNRMFPASTKSMVEVMREIMIKDGMPPEMVEMMCNEEIPSRQMFVISNSTNVNGASSIIYSNELEKLSNDLGCDLYILPSSTHEVIAVPSDIATPDELSEMVVAVNNDEVSIEEQLSDHVYKYDAETKTLSIADTKGIEMMKAQEEAQAEETEVSRPKRRR